MIFNIAYSVSKIPAILPEEMMLHTLVMVPCYSESQHSLRITLDSIANSTYAESHMTLFVVADGIIQGAGNSKHTHEYALDMMYFDERFSDENPTKGGVPPSYNYVALADGNKRKNFAKVYVGYYRPEESSNVKQTRQIPMILVVKVGNDQEILEGKKPGNRGKRDSQVILMNFLQKVMFDQRMTELEFDIFLKLWTISGVHPDMYEAVMMIDADTVVKPDALTHLVATLVRDPFVIGACGETKIANPWQSWVTCIQVYEYFTSHHLAKAFESVFGCIYILTKV